MSCASDKTEINTKESGGFVEKIVNFAIRNKDNQIIELPSLYDSLSKGLPAESKLILAESLKNKGFKEIESGRGNIPPRGPRIVSKIFHKDDCYCEVSKLYYFTTKHGILEMSERIKCMDKTAYEK
jgi:hypothetical protein